jgi:hypothetical protein
MKLDTTDEETLHSSRFLLRGTASWCSRRLPAEARRELMTQHIAECHSGEYIKGL